VERAHIVPFALILALGGVFQRGKTWYIDYYHRGRRKREKVGSSKGAAVQALSVREAEIAQGKFNLVSRRGAPTFEAVSEKYLELVSVHKRGHHVERYILRTLNAFFGKLRIVDIGAEDAEKYKTRRSWSVRPATVARELTLVRHVMTKAIEWGLIIDNPFRGVRNLSVPKRVERVLAPEEESRLVAACAKVRSRFLKPLIILAIYTGLRRSELLGLEWARIDLAKKTIRIINAKSTAGDRVIPMNVTVHSVLSEIAHTKNSEFVFPSNRNTGQRFLDLKKGFKKALRLANISDGLRWHDLRHTFASRLVERGVDIITVSKLMGHSKITMTARYAHSLDDAKIAAVSKLDLAGVCSVPDSNRTPSASGVAAESEVNCCAAST
jgi:integrase